MATSQTHFKWTDDKLTDLIKSLQEFKNYMNSESVGKSLNRLSSLKCLKASGLTFFLLSFH